MISMSSSFLYSQVIKILFSNSIRFWVSSFLIIFLCPGYLQTRGDDFLREVERGAPLKSESSGTEVYKIQSVFRKIYKTYRNKVVFVSTEKSIRYNRHPFAKDHLFEKFFGPSATLKRGRVRRIPGIGSGFIISRDGYICTNHHVISNVDKVSVRIGKETYKARVIGSDEITDIALLKVDRRIKFSPVYFGNSNTVKPGDWAIAIGNPFGFTRSFTVGVVSAVRGDSEEIGESYIQTDASINQGNSGGPLLNIRGEVIGINRMIYSRGGGSVGIGFAIPVNTARFVLKQLYDYGKVKWGFIGVRLEKMTPVIRSQLGLRKIKGGALIASVLRGSPAEKAGMQVDDVILKVGSKEIRSDSHLIRVVSRIKPGNRVPFIIFRDKRKTTLKVQVGVRDT